MSEQECGCNGEIHGHTLDGEPYLERTTDIGFCPLHSAAPAMLGALEEIAARGDRKNKWPGYTPHAVAYELGTVARAAIAQAREGS